MIRELIESSTIRKNLSKCIYVSFKKVILELLKELDEMNKRLKELDEMNKRLKEMEEEAAALREMQAKVEKEMGMVAITMEMSMISICQSKCISSI
ncbi:hypothetical protein Hanom_Chr13g01194661 [Helianthus anomalus]